jgi:hypothetical protein
VNLLTGAESTALFGGEISPSIRHLVDRARQAPREEAAAILWTACVSAPQSLPVYYLLYKLHAGLGELDRAEQAASKGLAAAARAAGLPADWRTVQPGQADFAAPGAARFWLFTLKALAFVQLRRGERGIAQALVDQLARLDPGDQIGASVVRALLAESGPSSLGLKRG